MSFQELQQAVKDCEDALDVLDAQRFLMEDKLVTTRQKLQNICDHEYKCEIDCDGHSTIRWYICSKCKHHTRRLNQ